jgi:cellulose synthase/poly-beta-1,6-N-acetylglucosamine synthase-like glycosyltransferase
MEFLLTALALAALVYFLVYNGLHLVFTAICWHSISRHLRARRHSTIEEVFASPLTPGISMLVPAFNEEAVIVESVRSLLALRYPRHEVIVVSDGSSDGTVDRLREAFDLVPVRKALRTSIPTAAVRAAYVSRRSPNLWVLDKENGGRSDALNAGVMAARYPYVCAIDADSLLEADALLRVAEPILLDPDRVAATGGIVRVANGCGIEHGRIVAIGLPRSRLATMQIVEYFRSFLVGRVGWSSINALLIISGAFGLFRRSLVETVGGFSTATVGEDFEVVVRLHRYLRDRDEPYRIAFVPDPVCWTEVPEDLRTLSRQRRRWQRGLGQVLWEHRRLTGNPHYGAVGVLALPYFLAIEFLGAGVALLGLPVAILLWALGDLSPLYFGAFLVVSFLLGILLSISALALEEFNFRRHPRRREVLRLLWYAVVENFGYRQLNDLWRTIAYVDLVRRRSGWGVQRRRGFKASDPVG